MPEPRPDFDTSVTRRWRTGRTLGRTVYSGPANTDLLGIFETSELAAYVVELHNATFGKLDADQVTRDYLALSRTRRLAIQSAGWQSVGDLHISDIARDREFIRFISRGDGWEWLARQITESADAG